MKILLITSFFPPAHTAGTEMRTLAYALGLQNLGHDVQVICVGKWEQGDCYWNGYVDEVYQYVSVRRIHLNWTLALDPNQYLYCNPLIEDYLEQWLEHWKPDIVHITSCLTLSASVIQSVKNKNIPVVLTLTDFWFICPRVNLLKGDGSLCDGKVTSWDCLKCMVSNTKLYGAFKVVFSETVTSKILIWISRHHYFTGWRGLRGMALDMDHRRAYLSKILEKVDCITAPSMTLGKLISTCSPAKNIKTIYSGHDLSWRKTLPVKAASRILRIAFIGQIIPIKGVHILLSAFCYANVTDQAELAIFGDCHKDPAYFRQLEKILTGQDGAIRFYGPFSRENLAGILSGIDVLVVPSLWHENNPRVIQEAYACQVPVIASNVDGISEFIENEESGLLFERGDVADLARQLRRLLDEPNLLTKLRSGMPSVKSIDQEIDELEKIYKDLRHLQAASIQ